MKQYAVSELVKEVKVILDRNQESAALVPTDSDTLSQGEIIRGVIIDAVRIIEENAPSHLLAGRNLPKLSSPTFTLVGDAYMAKMALPTDLMRLITIQMDDWDRPAKIISGDDDEYKQQFCKYSGVRGNPYRPIAALVQSESGDLELELFSCKSSAAKLKKGTYIAIPSILNDNIEICEKLKDAVLYMAAYLTCISLGDAQNATTYKATAYQLAGIVESSQTQ